jgi:hypothetical protein
MSLIGKQSCIIVVFLLFAGNYFEKNFWWDLFEIAQKCELMGPESGVVKPVRNSLAGSVTLFEKLRRS